MTSELRPAVEVWTDAEMAACHGAEYAAAAVIEADREAVRAEQAAELADLQKRYNDLGNLSLEKIGNAAREIVRLELELSKFKALAETLAGALEQFDQGCAAIGGCSDGYCVIQRPKGQHTNGGCRCSDDRNRMRRFASRAAYFREKVAQALTSYKEQRDAS